MFECILVFVVIILPFQPIILGGTAHQFYWSNCITGMIILYRSNNKKTNKKYMLNSRSSGKLYIPWLFWYSNDIKCILSEILHLNFWHNKKDYNFISRMHTEDPKFQGTSHVLEQISQIVYRIQHAWALVFNCSMQRFSGESKIRKLMIKAILQKTGENLAILTKPTWNASDNTHAQC